MSRVYGREYATGTRCDDEGRHIRERAVSYEREASTAGDSRSKPLVVKKTCDECGASWKETAK